MKLHSRDIKKLFALSKLTIKKEEEDSLARELSSVLSWVGTLQSADTENILPMTHPVPLNTNCNQKNWGIRVSNGTITKI